LEKALQPRAQCRSGPDVALRVVPGEFGHHFTSALMNRC
jgi:hypothetical protein